MKLNKIIVVMMVLMLAFNSITFAEDVQKSPAEINIKEIAFEILQAVSIEPEIYGLNVDDIGKLEICESIKPYTVVNNDLAQVDDIMYYPITSNGKVIANLTLCYAEDGSSSVTFSTEICKELNEFISQKKDGFILIHDSGNLYIKSKESIYMVKSLGLKTGKEPSEFKSNETVNRSCIKYYSLKSAGSISFDISSVRSSSNYKRLDMPYKEQGQFGLCWAAATASVGQYYTNISRTAKQVAETMGIGYDEGGTVIGTFSDGTKAHTVIICGYSVGSSGMMGIVRDSNHTSYKMIYQAMHNDIQSFSIDYYSGGTYYWINTCM